MRRLALAALLVALASAAEAADWNLVQETGATAALQTIQAEDYWGSYQGVAEAAWSLGAEWQGRYGLRLGLNRRWTATSAVVFATVYPGSEGNGWFAAADALVWQTPLGPGRLGLGATLAYSAGVYELRGLYRDFDLASVTLAPVAEWADQGLALRLRWPLALDLRPGFLVSWRTGLEVAAVFRGPSP